MKKCPYLEAGLAYRVYYTTDESRICVVPSFNGKPEHGHRMWSLKCVCRPSYGDEQFAMDVDRDGKRERSVFGPGATLFHKRLNPIMLDRPNGESIPVW